MLESSENQVDCTALTGHTLHELMALCERVRVQPGQSMTHDQERAGRVLVNACAAMLEARIRVPPEIRSAVASWIKLNGELE